MLTKLWIKASGVSPVTRTILAMLWSGGVWPLSAQVKVLAFGHFSVRL